MGSKRSIFLYPFSLIWRLITDFRNFLYNSEILSSLEFDIPVICVGNLTVGGTGKTPHAEYLIHLLKENYKVAFLSRGYKRKTSGFVLAGPSSRASDIGDEPLQIFRNFSEITVAVDHNRVRGVRKILEEKTGTDIIILDDGFQHRRITPGFSILLTDFERLMFRDHLLPYGNLRESIHNMERADIILITKSPADLPPIQRRLMVKESNKATNQNLYFTALSYKNPVPVFGNMNGDAKINTWDECADPGIVLVTGIANPIPLYNHLRNITDHIIHLQFGDHHTFTGKDIEKIRDAWSRFGTPLKYVFTTEKDAVRLREYTNIDEPFRSSFWYVPIGINFLNDDREEFDNIIIDYVRKNKRNNRISQVKRNNQS